MPRLRRHSVIVKANRVATIVTLIQRSGESPPQAILPIKTSRVDSCCDRLSCVLLSYNMGPEKDTVVGRVQRNIAYTTYAVFRSRYYIGSVTSWERSINSFPRKYFHFNIPNSYRFASLNMIRWNVVFCFPFGLLQQKTITFLCCSLRKLVYILIHTTNTNSSTMHVGFEPCISHSASKLQHRP